MENNKLTLITGNENKAKEFERLLGIEIDYKKFDLSEIQSTNVKKVSSIKAREAYGKLQSPVFVDDTGLTINAWGELPGALIKWFIDNVGTVGIIQMLADNPNRSARVTTAIAYMDSDREFVVTGEVEGSIVDSPRGSNGFGYDEIFVPIGYDKTFAEMTNQEKDEISMRALAASALKKELSL